MNYIEKIAQHIGDNECVQTVHGLESKGLLEIRKIIKSYEDVKSNVHYAIKEGHIDEEQGKELLEDYDKGMEWLAKGDAMAEAQMELDNK